MCSHIHTIVTSESLNSFFFISIRCNWKFSEVIINPCWMGWLLNHISVFASLTQRKMSSCCSYVSYEWKNYRKKCIIFTMISGELYNVSAFLLFIVVARCNGLVSSSFMLTVSIKRINQVYQVKMNIRFICLAVKRK